MATMALGRAGGMRCWSRRIGLAVLCLGLLAAAPIAALPLQLAVQGRLTSVGGGAVADGTYPLGVAVYADAQGGAAVFAELFLAVPVQGGVFALTLGGGATKLDTSLFADGAPRWVGVTVAGDAELARQPLRPVPMAVHSTVASSLQCSGCVTAAQLASNAVTADKIAAGAVEASHVAFAWAGADVPGGAATLALAANTAKQAQSADQAAFADQAGSAKFALAAKSADNLACTGCIDPTHLSAAVASAFLSTQGGTVSGATAFSAAVEVGGALTAKAGVSIEGGLALGGSAISGGRFAAIDVAKTACGANNAGQVALDTATKRLWLCDGSAFIRISTCTGQCKLANAVACGQPVTTDCGDVAAACVGSGTYCAAGACVNGKCLSVGDDASLPGLSCKDILAKNPQAKSGVYWVNPLGSGAYQADCDMTTKGGGWVRVLKGAERYGNKQAAFKSLVDGTFTEVRAVHQSGFIACNCGSANADYPWQACNSNNGDLYSFELITANKYVVQQTVWSALPTACQKPEQPKGDIFCSANWSVAKNADVIATWQEPSTNTSLSDNCGTQVIDLWAR